jgi:valine dehydrogenase (NAD+)
VLRVTRLQSVFEPYASEEDALHDVLELSRGMAYKNALAGLDLGGGKAVIWGDPDKIKSESLLRAYGRFVESLGGDAALGWLAIRSPR